MASSVLLCFVWILVFQLSAIGTGKWCEQMIENTLSSSSNSDIFRSIARFSRFSSSEIEFFVVWNVETQLGAETGKQWGFELPLLWISRWLLLRPANPHPSSSAASSAFRCPIWKSRLGYRQSSTSTVRDGEITSRPRRAPCSRCSRRRSIEPLSPGWARTRPSYLSSVASATTSSRFRSGNNKVKIM